ncbi:IMS-domain-containing protein [Wolfiporia cocos MD-104 SS10]|uniref:DNA polymerase kappa n=1 Tax=Wolfiporia cocos (strain MD-104) TaxID=742152 RepID=A0A2H3K2U5_WOLCO|nr:IMS-domain-containing protein [Wolfiporia cocos MD-104 SS10]
MHGPKEPSPPNPSPDSESLVKRLAGPSTTKAGLAKDQSEINRVIAEASKGSKFYENEKRKDRDLTDRIEKILKYRDEVLRGVDIRSVEQGVDQLLVKLEAQRDLSQAIVHVDMDAFYASVELLDNPALQGKAFAVGKGVLTTASYEARKFGVRSGMAAFIAKKLCPDLILVENRFHRYSEMSKRIMDIFRRYDPDMCAAGCDEGYLNITAYCADHRLTPAECVQQMRDSVREETKLTVSAGIAPNKMLAKICSDKNKPNGQYELEFEPRAIKAFMHDLSIRKVPGVGRVNERLLDSIGIKTCGDIYTHRGILALMDKQFGLHFLLQAFLGIASNVVQPGQREERKSIGAERTFTPLADTNRILQKLEEIAAELESDMEHGGWTGKTVTLKFKLDTYQVFTRAKSFDRWVSTKKEDLFAIGKELLIPELPLTIRLIGLRVTKLKDLRAELDSKVNGIKRFFQSAEPSSPRKRRRIDTEDVGDLPDEIEDMQLSQDGFMEVMPGFHEDNEADEDDMHASAPADDDDDPIAVKKQHLDRQATPAPNKPAFTRPRPPMSAPAPSLASTSTSPFMKPTSHKQRSARTAQGPSRHSSSAEPEARPSRFPTLAHPGAPEATAIDADAEEHTCPICGRSMCTDNQGLNAHIDFCLSKSAIREAQAAASIDIGQKLMPSARPSGSAPGFGKPKPEKKVRARKR